MRLKIFGLFVCMFVLVFSSAAQGWVSHFEISPKKPYVDEEITISWHTDRKLKPGYHYEGSLDSAVDEPECTKLAIASSKQRPKKGAIMRLTFSTENAFVSYPEWCDGQASITIYEVKGKELENGTMVGIARFRIYRKP